MRNSRLAARGLGCIHWIEQLKKSFGHMDTTSFVYSCENVIARDGLGGLPRLVMVLL